MFPLDYDLVKSFRPGRRGRRAHRRYLRKIIWAAIQFRFDAVCW